MNKKRPNRKKLKIHFFAFAALALFLVSILLFANEQKYQKPQPLEIMQSEQFPNVDIKISSTSYGKLDLAFGVTIPTSLTPTDVNTTTSYYPDPDIYLKIYNPTPETLNAQFDSLYQRGYSWYFSLGQNSSADTFLSAFFTKYPSSTPVVE